MELGSGSSTCKDGGQKPKFMAVPELTRPPPPHPSEVGWNTASGPKHLSADRGTERRVIDVLRLDITTRALHGALRRPERQG